MNTNKLSFSFFTYVFLLLSVDIFSLLVSLKVAVAVRSNLVFDSFPVFITEDIQRYYWILIFCLLVFLYEKIYFIRYDFWGDTKRVLQSLVFSFVSVLTIITLTKMSLDYSRFFLVIFFCIAIFIVPFFKRLFKSFLFKFKVFQVRVKVLAKDKKYEEIRSEVEKNWYFGFSYDEKDFDMVLIASSSYKIDELQKKIKKYSRKTKDIYVIPYMDHLDFTHTSIVDYSNIRLSAIHIENRLLSMKNLFIKNIFEKLLVISLSPLIICIHIIIVLLIKLDSKGPVRFKQKRYGQNARSFSCYKYRTMHINNDKILEEYLKKHPEEVKHYDIYCKYQNDPRITNVGKFLRKTSLDEFPQFYNILRGDMNLIGPRPYMIEEKKKIGQVHEEVILEVKPGITGLWQVSGRNDLTFKQRVELDKWYIQNWSLWMDFVIFVKTIKVVFSKVGAK